jgi:hypothetical protein
MAHVTVIQDIVSEKTRRACASFRSRNEITRRETCEKWIKACGRPAADFNIGKIKRSTYIHFTGGPENPDPIQALLDTDEQVNKCTVNKMCLISCILPSQ